MDEAGRKQQLCRLIRRRFPFLVVLRHEDLRTAGIPDISVSRGRATLWLEAKLGRRARTSLIQYEMLRKLEGFIVRYEYDGPVTVIEDASGNEVHRGRLHEPAIEIVQSRLL